MGAFLSQIKENDIEQTALLENKPLGIIKKPKVEIVEDTNLELPLPTPKVKADNDKAQKLKNADIRKLFGKK